MPLFPPAAQPELLQHPDRGGHQAKVVLRFRHLLPPEEALLLLLLGEEEMRRARLKEEVVLVCRIWDMRRQKPGEESS